MANFVETEQILELKPHSSSKAPVVCSFVQIRGSIPLLWSQVPNVKYKPPTKVSPTADTEPAFDAHISDLLQAYKVRLGSRLHELGYGTSQSIRDTRALCKPQSLCEVSCCHLYMHPDAANSAHGSHASS